MKKLHLSTLINAPVEKVWDATTNKSSYEMWTEVFHPGSTFEGSWVKGTKIRFVGPGETGSMDGMSSIIEENRLHEFISIKHIGFIKNGVEDTQSEEVKKWTPAHENYTFSKVDDNTTTFTVDMDVADNYYDYFLEIWPKSLDKLKEIAETGTSSTISTIAWIKAPIEKVWEYYTSPDHITKWAFADDSWEAPFAENDLREGGRFKTTMAAKDKSSQFDFTGTYTQVKPHELIEYTMDDGRKVTVTFSQTGESIQVIVMFEMEKENTRELQRTGWQNILNNFKKHVEAG